MPLWDSYALKATTPAANDTFLMKDSVDGIVKRISFATIAAGSTNAFLTNPAVANRNAREVTDQNFNSLTAGGLYKNISTQEVSPMANAPEATPSTSYLVWVMPAGNNTRIIQMAYTLAVSETESRGYMRYYNGEGWSSWTAMMTGTSSSFSSTIISNQTFNVVPSNGFVYGSGENTWSPCTSVHPPQGVRQGTTNNLITKGVCITGIGSLIQPGVAYYWDPVNLTLTATPHAVFMGYGLNNVNGIILLDIKLDAFIGNIGVVVLPTYVDNGNGTLTISSTGYANYLTSLDGSGALVKMKTPISGALTLTDNTVNYVYSDYNNGNPQWAVTTSPSTFLTCGTCVPTYRVIREGTDLHVMNYDNAGTALEAKLYFKDVALHGLERQTGLNLSTAATRISTISLGSAWFGITLNQLDANVAGTDGELYEYYLSSGNWLFNTVNLYDSDFYSNGTNRLSLGAGKWVAKYFFRGVEVDNDAYYTHGNQYNTAAEALSEGLPTPPVTVTAHSIYVGKIVIQQGATDGTAHPRLWEGSVQFTTSSSHATLSERDSVNQHPASAIQPDTTNFNNVMSSSDDTVQKALDTIDDQIPEIVASSSATRRQSILTGKAERGIANITRTNLDTYLFGKPIFLTKYTVKQISILASLYEPLVLAFANANKDYFETVIASTQPAAWASLASNTRHYFGIKRTGVGALTYFTSNARPLYVNNKESLLSMVPTVCDQKSLVPIMFAASQDGFVVSTSNEAAGAGYQVYDVSATSFWGTASQGGNLRTMLPTYAVVNRFCLRSSAQTTRAPATFKVYGIDTAQSLTPDHPNDLFTCNGHGYANGDIIQIAASVMPTGLTALTDYFVRDSATNTFKVAATLGGAAINFTSNGTTVTSSRFVLLGAFGPEKACTPNSTTDYITSTAHGYSNGDIIQFYGNLLPAELFANVNYYIINKTTDTFQVSLTAGGAAVLFTDNGSGVKCHKYLSDGIFTGYTSWVAREKKMFKLANSVPYLGYEIRVTATSGAGNLEMNAFDLLEKFEYVFDISEMRMYKYNYGVTQFVNETTIFVGDAVVGLLDISTYKSYSFQGQQMQDWFYVAENSNYVFNNLMGVVPRNVQLFWTYDLQSGEMRPVPFITDTYSTYYGFGGLSAVDPDRIKVYTGDTSVYDTNSCIKTEYEVGAPRNVVNSDFNYYRLVMDRGW
jgi:hypothetical protein